MSKILQLVLPFWVMARKYAKSYTDSRMTGLVGLAYGLALENGVMKMTVYDSRVITASPRKRHIYPEQPAVRTEGKELWQITLTESA